MLLDTISRLTEDDLYLFNEGSHYQLYEKLGAHPASLEGVAGTYFAVWAPNARQVSLLGDFNHWQPNTDLLQPRAESGIWEGFFPNINAGSLYKYHIVSRHRDYQVAKADPFAFHAETPPRTGSVVWDLDYPWRDQQWMQERYRRNSHNSPWSIYEVHLGSWMRVPEEGDRFLTYRELAPRLADYVSYMGFTHVEFLPLMEHPFYGSWGYQTTGYFAPTSRFGTPQDLMYLIDYLHQQGIGVILDWVPSHFPDDEHALSYFDGTHLFEHQDPRSGFHPDWTSCIFNYGRHEIRSFLISSALFWLDKYHVDGLRVDAVASMLYLDYSRNEGEWIPNQYGGRENLEAIDFLRKLNEEVYRRFPDVQTIAEESTSWPMVSRPTYVGGLGFGYKWDMGWMHDTLEYMALDPIFRKYHQNDLTFRQLYAGTENFILPLSHDEVVHGKAALLAKMPGDDWKKFANLRLLFGYMFLQNGKKLLFMGGEFAQWQEWDHNRSLDWHLLQHAPHLGMQQWVLALNHFYRNQPLLYQGDCHPFGFSWVDCSDSEHSVLSFVRRHPEQEQVVLGVFNFTPLPRLDYRIGVPRAGTWKEVLNSDDSRYGGSGVVNQQRTAEAIPWHEQPFSICLTVAPLAAQFFMLER